MVAGKKTYDVHTIVSKLAADVLDNILSVHAFTGHNIFHKGIWEKELLEYISESA
jgi:hypothetical protein